MEWWKGFVDKLAPIIVAIAAGEKRREIAVLFESVLARAKRGAGIARLLWHSWFLWITVGVRAAFLKWALLPIVLGEAVLLSAQRWCGGSFPVPWWIHLWIAAAALFIVHGLIQVGRDAIVRPVPPDLFDGRSGTPEMFVHYTPEQQARELEWAGHRSGDLVELDLAIARAEIGAARRKSASPEEETRLVAREQNLVEELAASRAFERQLRGRPATQPLMSPSEFDAALAPYGPLDRSPLSHMKAMAYELLVVAFLLLGADISLGSYAFRSGGVNLIFPLLMGVCGFAMLMLWSVAFWVAVVLPAEGVETAAVTPAKPITAVYQLVMQILPDIDKGNVEARFGRYTGQTLTKVRDQLKTWSKVSRVKVAAIYSIGLVLPHWFFAFSGLLLALVVGAVRANKELEGIDTKAERQADAVRLQKVFTSTLVAMLVLIFVLTMGREQVAGVLAWLVSALDAVLHPIAIAPPMRGGADHAWYVIKCAGVFLLGLAVINTGMDWSKAKTPIKPKIGAALAVFGALIVINVVFSVPRFGDSTTVQAVHGMLMCPVSPTSSSAVRSTMAQGADAPSPSTTTAVTAAATATPPVASQAASPSPPSSASAEERSERPRRSRSRSSRSRRDIVLAEDLGCSDAENLPPCDEGTYGADVATLRRACLCR